MSNDVIIFADPLPDVEVTADNETEVIAVPEQGPSGDKGEKGDHGTTLLVGETAPTNQQGVNGDSWWDKLAKMIYGPKANDVWPAPVSLVGPQGPEGDQGIQGEQGIQGPTGNTGNYYKNYIFNPAMMASIENDGASGSTNNYYPVEGFYYTFSHAGTATVQRVASVTPGGSPYRVRLTVGTAVASPAAGNYALLAHTIEGVDVADLRIGTASAKQVTLQFGVKAPAGTYYVSFVNSGSNRSYIAAFTVSAGQANTDVQKSVTITLDTSGTWLITEGGSGLRIYWTLMAGSSFTGSAGTWAATQNFRASDGFNLFATSSNVFELFDVSLTIGDVAPAFLVPDLTDTLWKCYRYCELSNFYFVDVSSAMANRNHVWPIYFRQQKAVIPNITLASLAYNRCSTGASSSPNINGFYVGCIHTGLDGDDFGFAGVWTANARIV